jgi:SAM-dependent methyltransferase
MTYGDDLGARLRFGRIGPKLRHEARRVLAPIAARLTPLRHETFPAWDGAPLPYFVHPYNTTWHNERAVEVPLADAFLAFHGRGSGMELGNVLHHYGRRGDWEVVDKYERSSDVTNVDILDYRPPAPLDFIVSISTLEHVGWDEEPRDAEKALAALGHLRRILAPRGLLFLTVPLGYNPALDAAVADGSIETVRDLTLVHEGRRWRASTSLADRPAVRRSALWTGAVWVAEIGAAT